MTMLLPAVMELTPPPLPPLELMTGFASVPVMVMLLPAATCATPFGKGLMLSQLIVLLVAKHFQFNRVLVGDGCR